MRLIAGLYAVFWSPPGCTQQFHADVGAMSPVGAAATFRNYFPTDKIRSVRDSRGRFVPFKGV